MKIQTLCIWITLLLSITTVKAERLDSLILNDGKVVTGVITPETMRALLNMQLNLDNRTAVTEIKQADGSTMKIPSKEVKYFHIDGIKYVSHPMVGGHKFMQVVLEGKASLYIWGGTISIPNFHRNSSYNPWATSSVGNNFKNVLEVNTYGSTRLTVLVINGKTYTPTASFLEKQFEKFFGDCPKLMELSKAPDFNYKDIGDIVDKYNACF